MGVALFEVPILVFGGEDGGLVGLSCGESRLTAFIAFIVILIVALGALLAGTSLTHCCELSVLG